MVINFDQQRVANAQEAFDLYDHDPQMDLGKAGTWMVDGNLMYRTLPNNLLFHVQFQTGSTDVWDCFVMRNAEQLEKQCATT